MRKKQKNKEYCCHGIIRISECLEDANLNFDSCHEDEEDKE